MRARPVRLTLLVAAFLAVSGSQALAAPFVLGQVFASVGSGTVKVFNPDGTLAQTLSYPGFGTFNTGSAFDAAGNFYVTEFTNNFVAVFDSNGVFQSSFSTSPASNESIVVNAAQQLYIGHADGLADIDQRTTAGVLIDQDDPAVGPRGTDWIDLAADQQTMYYTSEGTTIHRFDVATDTQLADFATGLVGSNCFALRILADGGALVACSQQINRVDASGTFVQSYDIGTQNNLWFGLNLDPDGSTFWTGDLSSGLIARFNINTGALVTSFNSDPLSSLAGLSVFGEITQAIGGTTTTTTTGAVPEPASLLLLGTGVAGMIGCRRRRRR